MSAVATIRTTRDIGVYSALRTHLMFGLSQPVPLVMMLPCIRAIDLGFEAVAWNEAAALDVIVAYPDAFPWDERSQASVGSMLEEFALWPFVYARISSESTCAMCHQEHGVCLTACGVEEGAPCLEPYRKLAHTTST
jgi:hypothetical protein